MSSGAQAEVTDNAYPTVRFFELDDIRGDTCCGNDNACSSGV